MASADAAAPRGLRRLDYRLRVLLLATLAGLVLLPFDAGVAGWFGGLELPSDLRSELKMLQQYGQFTATVLASLLVLLLDPRVRLRLLDWWAALGLSSLLCHACKMTLGRPRPKLHDPYVLTLPWESYLHVRPEGSEVIRAFDFHGAALWSMPSSHTAAALVMSLFLARLYPRLAPFAVGMAVVVGLARVALRQHYPTDVVVGALVGFLVADAVWKTRLGQRAWALLQRGGEASA